MSLRDASAKYQIETAQARAVINAGGCGLSGCFAWTINGWELTLKGLSFQELIRVVETVKEIVK